jgi:membrane protein YdbS with pleckstrin-like domain
MKPLSPSQKKVLRARGLISAAVLLGAALVAEAVLASRGETPVGIIAAVALLLGAMLAFVLPARRYRAWGYDATEDELYVQNGIWVETRTVVPFGRVQHIDVSQGPIERRYGVGALTLHTAGTRASAVVLPGLDMTDAERMRDEIRGKIRQDLV